MSNIQRNFEEILNDALDERLTPGEMARFRAMLDGDAVRREEFESFQRMRALLRATGTEKAPLDVVRRVRAAIDGESAGGSGSGSGWLARVRQMGWVRSAALFLALITGAAIVIHESPWQPGGGAGPALSDWSVAEGEVRRPADARKSSPGWDKDGLGAPPPEAAAPAKISAAEQSDAEADFARKRSVSGPARRPRGGEAGAVPPAPAAPVRLARVLDSAEHDLQRVERQLEVYSLQMPSVQTVSAESGVDGSACVLDAVATLGRNLGALREAEVLSVSFESLAEDGDHLLSRLAGAPEEARRVSPAPPSPKHRDLQDEDLPAEMVLRARSGAPAEPSTAPIYLVSGPGAVASVGRSTGAEPVRLRDLFLRDSPEAMAQSAAATGASYAFFLVSLDAPGAVSLVSAIESQAGLSVRALNRPEDGEPGPAGPGTAGENKGGLSTRLVLIALDR